MPTHIGIGFSQNPNPSHAVQEAVNQAKTQVKQLDIQFAMIFSTIHYSSAEISSFFQKTLPNTKIIGTSTAGIILSDFIATRGLAILAISSDQVHFGIGAVGNLEHQDIREAGLTLAKEIIEDFGQHRRQVFGLLTDGLLKDGFQLIDGLQETLGHAFPIIGGGSSDDFHFKKTYQYFKDKLLSSSACGFLMGGQMSIGLGSHHGWKPLGKPRIVDKTEGVRIKTINGKRASRIYEEYFEKEMKSLLSTKLEKIAFLYPLGIYLSEEGQYLIRNAVDILNDGSIICQGAIPEGSEVHLMIGNRDYCREAAIAAAQQAKDGLYGRPPKLMIIFESLFRKKILGRGALKEIQAIRDVLGHGTPTIGMYTLGEVAPLQSLNESLKTHLQNESIVILALG